MNENINKVIYGTSTLIDLTEDTVSPNRMYKGDIAHDASGAQVIGTAEITVDGTTLIMPEGLCTPVGIVDPETTKWIRPAAWPDLSSVYNNETNTLWMTIDATGRIPDPHVSVSFTGAYTVQVGSIQNGIFTAESTESKASNTTWKKVWTPAQDYYPVVKITGTGNITTWAFNAWTADSGAAYAGLFQAIVEWIGHIYGITNTTRTPYFVEYEKIKITTCAATGLQYRWQDAWSLLELDCSNWDTSSWALTNLHETWRRCRSLRKLDVTGWDTSNWKVTALGYTWSDCFSLESLDLDHWDTSGWTVRTLQYTWSSCQILKNLKVSTWDTSKWTVTTMQGTWQYCRALKELDISGWDTSNWKVTNIQYTWYYDYNLRALDLNSWDTSGWTVTTSMSNTWYYCCNLESLEIGEWNTSGWAVPSLSTTWGYCAALKYLDLNKWDTSNWNITSLSGTWNNCVVMEHLGVKNWDTSKWTVTTIASTWNGCCCLKDFEASHWDTSNWPVINAKNTFNWLAQNTVLDLSGWDTSKWTLTETRAMSNFCQQTHHLKYLNLSSFDLSKITDWRDTSSYFFNCCYMLQDIVFGSSNNGKIDCSTTYPVIRFDWSPLLTKQSILNIFAALKSGVTGKTLQLGTTNLNRLTAAEKAIATDKGWTLT